MEVQAKDLRKRIGDLLACVDRGESVVITYRGKPRVRLVRFEAEDRPTASDRDIPGFGMWTDRADMEDVHGYVRNLRRPRDAD